MSDKIRFGEILVRAGVLEREHLEQAMAVVGEGDADLGEHLVRRGLVDEAAMLQAISRALNLPTVSLANVTPDERALGLVPRELCVEFTLFPVELESTRGGDHLHVAMANPSDVRAIKQITRKARRRIRPLVAPAREIRQAIAQHYGGGTGSASVERETVRSVQSESPVDMFDFDVTDLSSSDAMGLEGLSASAVRSAASGPATDVQVPLGRTVEFGPGDGPSVNLSTLSGLDSSPAGPARPTADPVRGEAPAAPVRRTVALYSSPPLPPVPPENVFEHSTFGDGRPGAGTRQRTGEAPRSAPPMRSMRPSAPSRDDIFEHSERLSGISLPSRPPPLPSGPSRSSVMTREAPTSRPPMPGPPVSLAPLPVALSSSPPRSLPGATPRIMEPAPTEGAGMMIRKRRRGPDTPALGFSIPAGMPPPLAETPTPSDGIDIRRLFDRIDTRDEDLGVGDAIISRYLERFGAATTPPTADEFLASLERAVGRAGSPTAQLLIVLVRRLARSGLLDPEDLVADLNRR